ncbi:hypothetical protein [Pseudoalteromonas piratica]|uniref:hypothetical protein n=1 Tax=Pseudoalteromonas piratica TaxID=1348114 RepID=UPI000B00ED18|nr:hypothetical protein [Pseudoalteromonas piratica]
MAVSLSRLKRYDEAESIYQQGLNVAPDNLDILINYRILAKTSKTMKQLIASQLE